MVPYDRRWAMMGQRSPVTTMADLRSLEAGEVFAGYRAGFDGDALCARHSRSFWHGWRQGRVDAGLADPDDAMRRLARNAVYVDEEGDLALIPVSLDG